MKKLLLFGLLGFSLPVNFSPAIAQVFLKPTSAKAVPVRVQSLHADVHIFGSFAITNWELGFEQEGAIWGSYYNYNSVATFVCARPADAKVTAFGIKDGNKGKVVESFITPPRVTFPAAKDDPLFRSGLKASNSFRANIYPLPTWGNVTLQGTWFQLLGSSANRSQYRFPLLGLKGLSTRVKDVSVQITVHDSDVAQLSNNYGLPVARQNDTQVISLNQKNYRIVRDLGLTVAHKPAPLHASLLVAPSTNSGTNNTEGNCFALALTADRPLKHPRLLIPGTPEVSLNAAPDAVQTGETLLLSGTYTGELNLAGASLAADGFASPIQVSPTVNETTRAIWATQKINGLSRNAKANRDQIIALSKRYSVISPFTSWLITRDEDLRIYQYALVSGQLDPLVREYWLRMGAGQQKSTRVAQLKRDITRISVGNHLTVREELYARLGSAIQYAEFRAYPQYTHRIKPKPLEGKRYRYLLGEKNEYVKSLNLPKSPYGDQYTASAEVMRLYDNLFSEYRKPHPDYEAISPWEKRLTQVFGSTKADPRLTLWWLQINSQNLEIQSAAAQHAGDNKKVADLQLQRLYNSHALQSLVNPGDPPIYISAPANSLQVVAIMPDLQVKTLEYNSERQRWEGNYDVPTSMKEGAYPIQIVIVNADDTRRRYTMTFQVDTTAPTGSGQVQQIAKVPASQSMLRLEVSHGGDVARVAALLPWGQKVTLQPSETRTNTFFGSVEVPTAYRQQAIRVTYILTDRAHNITTVGAESVPAPSDSNF